MMMAKISEEEKYLIFSQSISGPFALYELHFTTKNSSKESFSASKTTQHFPSSENYQ